MSLAAAITSKLTAGLNLEHIELVNESYKHNVPDDAESHFKVLLVSSDFEKKPPMARHRMVYALLDEEMKMEGGIHALSIEAKTPEQYAKNPNIQKTPACAGGDGGDKKAGE
jgi:BolA protein